MNQLVKVNAATLGGVQFGAIVRTSITNADGTTASVVAFVSDPSMVDGMVESLNNTLKEEGNADHWSHQVADICNGMATTAPESDTITAADIITPREQISGLWRQLQEQRRQTAAANDKAAFYVRYQSQTFEDLLAAHTKIGGLHYILESHGITIPEHLK